MLADMFARARTTHSQCKRKVTENISNIDIVAARGFPKQLNEEYVSLLRVLTCGGAWGKEARHAIDRADDMQCELCGGAKHTPEHTAFYRTRSDVVKSRADVDEELANLNPDLLPSHINM